MLKRFPCYANGTARAKIIHMFHSLYNRTAGSASAQGSKETHLSSTSSQILPSVKACKSVLLDWPASYLTDAPNSFQAINSEHWRLEINGLVEKAQKFCLKDLIGFTRIQQNRRLVFADGWAYRATWEGFVIHELLHRVSPLPEAQYLVQKNLAGQQECIPLKDLYAQRALFCMKVNGKNLPDIYGGPMRLLVFDRYAHKGLGQIVSLTLSDTEVPSYFTGKGYDADGEIKPGNYYAADLKTIQTVRVPGEITQW